MFISYFQNVHERGKAQWSIKNATLKLDVYEVSAD